LKKYVLLNFKRNTPENIIDNNPRYSNQKRETIIQKLISDLFVHTPGEKKNDAGKRSEKIMINPTDKKRTTR
jgi:hypothetical protein